MKNTMRVIPWTILCILGVTPSYAQDAGGVTTSAIGRVGQRQTGTDAAISSFPTARIRSRIDNRIESRVRTRIQSGYDSNESATSQVDAAATQARITRR